MKVYEWAGTGEQYCEIGQEKWSVSRLIDLAKGLEVMEVPLDHIYLYYTYDKMKIREMVMHIKAILDADLDAPIILDEDGTLMDGRHRLMRAMLDGKETIKAVRFDVNPPPCILIDTK